MKVMQGRSSAADAREAVAEATAGWAAAPELVWVFSSTRQDPDAVAAALAERLPGAQIAGCTTAGEQLGAAHSTGDLVLTGLVDSGLRWGVRTVEGLSEIGLEQLRETLAGMAAELGAPLDSLSDGRGVCLLFVDGLRGAEERVSALLAEALDGVRLAGGSAGDDLQFQQTRVYGPQGARPDAATIVLAMSVNGAPVQILKHQHFTPAGRHVAVTRAEGRRVYELDGRPALEVYAEALGLSPAEVTGEVTFLNPVTLAIHGELYVRSVQAVLPDGSLNFYCAVDEGVVVDIARHGDMQGALSAGLSAGFAEPPAFVLGFNCILRALEATGKGLHGALGQTTLSHCDAYASFDTYGEQLDGLHINQTLVAVGFGRRAA